MTTDRARRSASSPFPAGGRAAAALLAGLALLALSAPPAAAQEPFPDATGGLERQEGFFPLYHDAGEGRLLMEVPEDGPEFLYLVSQATGVGSDELGLDLGAEELAHRQAVAADVRRFLSRDFGERILPGALDPPRGTPIGEGGSGGGGG